MVPWFDPPEHACAEKSSWLARRCGRNILGVERMYDDEIPQSTVRLPFKAIPDPQATR
jgi:hypothetical protein